MSRKTGWKTGKIHRLERFLQKIKIVKHGCWEWIGSHFPDGYGQVQWEGRPQVAHRISFAIFVDEKILQLDPRKFMVLHECDNKGCVRPKHLYLGNAGRNLADAVLRGGYTWPTGFDHHSTKLNVVQVKRIRKLLSKGIFQKQIALKFGISQSQISSINLSRTYKDVK